MAELKDGTSSLTTVVHDFSGHPFQVQLARRLAERGIPTTHVYCDSFQTPKGHVGDDDSSSRFRSVAVSTRSEFAKYSTVRRLGHELEYGWKAARTIRRIGPDVVISANVPLVAAFVFQLAMLASRIKVIFWQQDVYSVAMANHLRSVAGRPGAVAGWLLIRLERWLLKTSKRVVVISQDFIATLADWKIDLDKVTVIENWAPLDEMPVRTRPNQWSEQHGVTDDDVVFVYAGTLGLKHHPSALLALAKACEGRTDVKIFIASEGIGAEWLSEHGGSAVMTQLPFQDWDVLPDMLGTADVLMVLLESDAGTFSVPSKVLTYQCAGRAILGAMPAENLASRTLAANGAGVVVRPGDDDAFVAAALALVDDRDRRVAMGVAARDYAERTFDIDTITERFSTLIEAVAAGEPPQAASAPASPDRPGNSGSTA